MEIGFIRVAARYNAKYHKYKRDTWRYISQIKMGHMKTYITNITHRHVFLLGRLRPRLMTFLKTAALSEMKIDSKISGYVP